MSTFEGKDGTVVPLPDEYLAEAAAYAEGYVVGRKSAPKTANLDAQLSKQRAHNEHLDRANRELRGRLDAAKAERDELKCRVAELEERAVHREKDRTFVIVENKKIIADICVLRKEQDALAKRVAELEKELAYLKEPCADPPQIITPPRPRLFSTAEKDEYFSTCCGVKLFANEISRGWWTIAVNGQPILEVPTP